MDSHKPATKNQITLDSPDITPALGRRITVRPKDHKGYLAKRKEATPTGIVTTKMQAKIPNRQ